MTSRKAKSRGQTAQQPIPQSDYETDAANLIDTAAPPLRTTEELNLSVLQSYVPEILSIVSIASVTALYLWQTETSQWEKSNIEGSLFVCQLTPAPSGASRFAVMVLNRRGLDNFYTLLEKSDDIEITDEYVILNTDVQVYGL